MHNSENLLNELARVQAAREEIDARADAVEVEIVRMQAEMEQQLVNLEANLQLRERAIEASQNAILLSDALKPDHPIVYVNPAFEHQTGYSVSEVLGRSCGFLYSTDENEPEITRIRNALNQGKPCHAEFCNKRKDGSTFWAEHFISPVKNGDGEVTHFIVVQVDISARKHAEAELARRSAELEQANCSLRHLDHLRANLIGMVSHELRTPLSTIIGYAEFLDEQIEGPLTDGQRKFVKEITTSAQRLEALVNDMLDYARIEDGSLRLMPTLGDFSETVRLVAKNLTPQIQARHMRLNLALPPRPLLLVADHDRLAHVMSHLLTNALKFTREGGEITVVVSGDEKDLRVAITDTGIGIAKEHLNQIFEKFYQVDTSSTRPHSGAGLGLGIAKALVEAHGGTIGVKSFPGDGSTFWFNLPREGVTNAWPCKPISGA